MKDYEEYLEEDFVIWNPSFGVRDFVNIGKIDSDSAQAWLDDPYDMVGPFSLDELVEEGKISFAACFVMTKEKWQKDQARLQREAFVRQQKIQEEFIREVNKNNARKRAGLDSSEKEHRKLLCLDSECLLEVSQIKEAYRKVVKKAHPDVGGSHDEFIKITHARDSLLEIYEV